MRYKRIGYNINVMRQSACQVINPITVDSFASFFNCTPAGRSSIRLNDAPNIKLVDLFKLVCTRFTLLCRLVIRGSTGGFLLLQYFRGAVSHPKILRVSHNVSVWS